MTYFTREKALVTLGSNLDVGSDLPKNMHRKKIVKSLKKDRPPGDPFVEELSIAPGNMDIVHPELFFNKPPSQRHEGCQYRPSGSITVWEDGSLQLIPPHDILKQNSTVTFISSSADEVPPLMVELNKDA